MNDSILAQLLAAAKKVNNPSPEMQQAIAAADQHFEAQSTFQQLEKLGEAVKDEDPTTRICMSEDNSPDNRYALEVRTDDSKLLRKLAVLFGCPEGELPGEGETSFEAQDDWHGRGEVDLRGLADEITRFEGEFFTLDASVQEIRQLAKESTTVEKIV